MARFQPPEAGDKGAGRILTTDTLLVTFVWTAHAQAFDDLSFGADFGKAMATAGRAWAEITSANRLEGLAIKRARDAYWDCNECTDRQQRVSHFRRRRAA